MKVEIIPSKLNGKIAVPPSKSFLIRAIICGALLSKKTVIKTDELIFCDDVNYTLSAIKSFGAKAVISKNNVTVFGTDKSEIKSISVDVGECGLLLRVLISVCLSAGISAKIQVGGNLLKRKIKDSFLGLDGIKIKEENGYIFVSGKTEKNIELSGSISSQHVSGFLIGFSLFGGQIKVKEKTSSPYIDMTIKTLKKFGVKIEKDNNAYNVFKINKKKTVKINAEKDYSLSAFYFAENILGGNVKITGLKKRSKQGDKIAKELFCGIEKHKNAVIKADDIPDLIPLIVAIATIKQDETVITGAERLKYKESDRLLGIEKIINGLGGKVSVTDGKIIVKKSEFTGGTVDCFFDHRLTFLATLCSLNSKEKSTLINVEGINKSYPSFFKDVIKLGGKVNVL